MGWEELTVAVVVVAVVAARRLMVRTVRRTREAQGHTPLSGRNRWAILAAGVALGLAFALFKATA